MSTLFDLYEQKILDIIQTDFPLTSRPYASLGEAAGLSEQEAFDCVQGLRQKGIIRRIGANFQSAKLGFFSSLCAAKVPQHQVEEFSQVVNALPGVTHNYLRAHAYNIWFTLIAPSWNELCITLDDITKRTGIPVLNLPATRLYKIRVDFRMEEPT